MGSIQTGSGGVLFHATRCAVLVALLTAGGCATVSAPAPEVDSTAQAVQTPDLEEPRLTVAAKSGAYFHFILGHQLELAHEFERALSQYLAALTYNPTDRETLVRTAALYLQNGDTRGAIESAESALERYPADARLLRFLARLYESEGNREQAEENYRRLIAVNPDDPKPYYMLILSYIKDKQFGAAQDLLKTVQKNDPDSTLPLYYKGRIQRLMGHPKRAIWHLRRSIKKAPLFEASYLDLAGMYEVMGKREKARKLYETVVADVNPLSPVARDRLIQMYLQDGDLEGMLRHYDAVLSLNPRNPILLMRRSLVLAELGRLDDAIDSVSQVLTLTPSDLKALEMLASLFERADRMADARDTYRRMVEISPSNIQGWVRLGYLADNLDDTVGRDEAVDAAVELLDHEPENVALHLFISWGYLRGKRYEEAVDILERAVSIAPENISAHFSLGATLYELERIEEMEQEMFWVLERDPKHAYALNFLGYSYAERGINLSQSEAYLMRALEIRPDDGLILDSLAWVYFKQERYKEALKVQLRAIERLEKHDAVLFDHLGSIYLKLNRTEEARDNWVRALQDSADDPELADLKVRFREAGFGDPDQVDSLSVTEH